MLVSVLNDVIFRYGPESLGLGMGKILTADRMRYFNWKISRVPPDETFENLPMTPPEEFRNEGSTTKQRHIWEHDKQHMIEGALSHRRFTVSKTGYIGLVPEPTEVGDKICVLFGCDTPVV